MEEVSKHDQERALLKEVYGDLYDDLVRVYEIRTICEVLREIYWGTQDRAIREKAEEAMVMAKKLVNALSESRSDDWGKIMDWKPNPYMDIKRWEQAVEEANEDRGSDVRKG